MFDRLTPILKGACVLLALLLIYQVSRIAFRKDPLSDLNISPFVVPALAGPSSALLPSNHQRPANSMLARCFL